MDRLLSRLREKHRRYHTASHVAWVLRHIEELAQHESIAHFDEIVAAAFYHDAVYEPAYPANERASARLARRDLTALGWPQQRVERVATMIEATEHASDPDVSGDAAILLDADLAVLAGEPGAYSTYLAAVRGEFRHVDDDEWRVGRAQVLRSFLDRPHIFATTYGRAVWEQHARRNLTAELATLS